MGAMHSSNFPPTAPQARPRLALVIGSGGVRGVAAIGVAEVLAREGLQPELIVGCSSGALFGAPIALGMPSRDALAAATSYWSADLTQQKRWRAFAQLLAPKLFGFGADFALRDDRRIAQAIEAAFGGLKIEDSPTPLRIAATDAASGAAVVLTRGSLPLALRASVAVPFLFPSIEFEGRHLVDGVISDPLPMAAASDAQVIVTLGFQGSMPRRVDRASRMVAQVSTALINNLQQAREAAARAAGQRVLHLELGLDRRVGLWETDAMPYLFEAGRRAALTQLPQIAALFGTPIRRRVA
jgi:NTE family protein